MYSRQAGEIQVKTMTQAFHLEADNIPVTFPGKCQGLDRSLGWQATKHGKQERGGGEPSAFPSNAKECDSVRAGTESVCKSIVFTSMESQTGGSASTEREIHSDSI